MTVLMIPSVDLEPWPSLGFQVADWIQDNLVHGPGDLRGQPVRLDEEKRMLLYRMYEVFPQDHPQAGRRRFKRCGLSVRKGWAKTEFAAMIAAAELHPEGPVRCHGWDGHGNPIAGPVTDPYIPLVAYTEEQSDELAYSALKVMLEEGPLRDDFDIGLMRIMRKRGDGKAVSLASSPDARDGARTTFQVADETHRWTLPRLRQAHRTMLANLPKRRMSDAWALETTTSFSPGEGSVAESTMDYARAVADGTVSDSRLFFFHRQAKDTPADQGGYDLAKPEDIKAAVIEASGPVVAEWSDIDSIVEQFNDPTADRQYLCRVWLNWITQASDRAFDAEQWRMLAAPQSILPGELITLGFDGSRWHDSTAIVATHIASGYQWLVGVWERPTNLAADAPWEVPQEEVTQAMAAAFERWDVWRLYADPPYWETQVAEWAGEYGEHRVLEWRTNRHAQMGYALRSYAGSIQAGEVTHDGSAQFAAHIGNSCKRLLNIRDDKGERLWAINKERPDSPHKIDIAIAAALSWESRTDAISEGVGERSVYESRGILVW